MTLALKNIERTINLHAGLIALNSKIKDLKKWIVKLDTPKSFLNYLETQDKLFEYFEGSEYEEDMVYDEVLSAFIQRQLQDIKDDVEKYYNLYIGIDVRNEKDKWYDVMIYDVDKQENCYCGDGVSAYKYAVCILYNRVIAQELISKAKELKQQMNEDFD